MSSISGTDAVIVLGKSAQGINGERRKDKTSFDDLPIFLEVIRGVNVSRCGPSSRLLSSFLVISFPPFVWIADDLLDLS